MLSEERMQQLCDNWREALNLKDWTVELKVVGLGKLKLGTLGDCNMVVTKKHASIQLLAPEHFAAMRSVGAYLRDDEFEQERCLVHELIHLHYAALDSLIGVDNVAEVILEQAISSIDCILVELAHAARGQVVSAAGA